jgi:transcriptional regulator with XRE-family HTH domain
MVKAHLSQRDVADLLQWSQSKVSKLLKGRSDLGVDDLSALCFAVGITLTEAIRDRGMEFYAEMAPTELRVLERLRGMSPALREAFLLLLDVRTSEVRMAAPPRPPRGPKPR